MTARKRKVIDYKKLAGLVETDVVETSETCGLCGLSKRLTKSAINEVLDNGQTVNDFVSTFFLRILLKYMFIFRLINV